MNVWVLKSSMIAVQMIQWTVMIWRIVHDPPMWTQSGISWIPFLLSLIITLPTWVNNILSRIGITTKLAWNLNVPCFRKMAIGNILTVKLRWNWTASKCWRKWTIHIPLQLPTAISFSYRLCFNLCSQRMNLENVGKRDI